MNKIFYAIFSQQRTLMFGPLSLQRGRSPETQVYLLSGISTGHLHRRSRLNLRSKILTLCILFTFFYHVPTTIYRLRFEGSVLVLSPSTQKLLIFCEQERLPPPAIRCRSRGTDSYTRVVSIGKTKKFSSVFGIQIHCRGLKIYNR